MNKTTEALKLAEKLLSEIHRGNMTPMAEESWDKALAAIREALAGDNMSPTKQTNINLNCKSVQARLATSWGYVQADHVEQEPVAWMWVCVDVESRSIETGLLFNRGADDENTDWTPLYAAPVKTVKQEPVARPFECWSTNDGDSWFEHPADAQLIYDVLGDDPKVGDEFEVSAGWNCVTATYQIASKDGDDFEVKCVSHPNNDAAPVSCATSCHDAEAIRAEAFTEAEEIAKTIGGSFAEEFIAAIRKLK